MKVGARKLRGKATTKKKAVKKVAKKKSVKRTKPAVKKTKKATAIAKVKSLKHKRVTLTPVGTPNLPDMVLVADGPAWVKPLIGKKYINTTFAIAQIEALDSEKVIAKGAKSIVKELVSAGLTPMEAVETSEE